MITDKLLDEMPFRDVTEIMILDNKQNNAANYMYNMSTNNDCLVKLDLDHNILENGTVKKCSNYDTSLEFNKTFSSENNISILHLNICSSQHKLTDLTYYLENINATNFNDHILNIPNYQHEQCIRSNNKKGGGTSLYINKDIQYKNRNYLSFKKTHYESIFIEVDKALFNTNRNTILREIYKPPSSNLKTFNIEMEKLLVKKKEKKSMLS